MKKNAVVIYKNACALAGDSEGDKFMVSWCVSRGTPSGKKANYASQKVRNRDVIVLCEGPASNLDAMLDYAEAAAADGSEVKNSISEVYELLISDESSSGALISFEELAALIKSDAGADQMWGIYSVLKNGLEFEEKLDSSNIENVKINFIPRSQEKIQELKNKAFEKEHAEEIRNAFIHRLRQNKLELPEDAKFMVEVEAFALGKTDKCRTLKDAGFKETVERAHEVLLNTGIWDITRNPYPVRWGLSAKSAVESLGAPPQEERVKVDGVSYAIDSPWSTDPDDAIGFDGEYLWVHIADPASTVMPESSIDKSARGRGATLYLPEGAARMLAEDCIEDYALGLKKESNALSFKIKLSADGEIESCDVLRTVVNVERLTYEKADELKETPELKPLFEIAAKNAERRKRNGAVSINMPEIHVKVDPDTKQVHMEEIVHYESGEVVREAMILAGEGAARFAFKNNIPFPFISQDAPDIPEDIPEGLAGQYRLRRCMRKRNVGVTPGAHAAMGLSMYSQVTSPLRRYGDLIGHQQLRAFIKGEKLIDKDEMLMRVAEGDAAMRASKQAERNSNTHWTLVYLLQNPQWSGKAVCLNKDAKGTVFLVRELGLETVIEGTDCGLNDEIEVKADKIDLPSLSVSFIPS